MLIVLPDADDGLAALEKGLTAEKLRGWAGRLATTKVRVTLPRFTVKGAASSMKNPLAALGMMTAFAPGQADFTGMGRGGLWLGDVVHDAFVEVKEEGTEAAAATRVDVKETSAPPGPPREPDPVVFRADHPFLFLIRDRRSGCVVFLGRLVVPWAVR